MQLVMAIGTVTMTWGRNRAHDPTAKLYISYEKVK